MSFFSEQESVDLREARAQVVELVGRELALREENARLRVALEAHYLPGACPDCDAALAPEVKR